MLSYVILHGSEPQIQKKFHVPPKRPSGVDRGNHRLGETRLWQPMVCESALALWLIVQFWQNIRRRS